jgi:protein-S-isoprenylcysteine O-methyltransferase Ste14
MKNHEDSPKVITLPPLVFLGGIVAGFIVDTFLPMPFVSESYDVRIGVALILIALATMAWAVRAFNEAGTNVDVRQPAKKVVAQGPFQFTRNPMYVSMALFSIGAAIWLNSLWILLGLIIALIVTHYGVIVREEAYLEKKFGKEYSDYKAKVRRWI